MLKFVKQHMESISGIEIYPIISFLIFFVFFLLVGIWVFTVRKDKIIKIHKPNILAIATDEINKPRDKKNIKYFMNSLMDTIYERDMYMSRYI